MLSPGSDLALLQQKSDIVSALAVIFCFEITILKLRSLLMEWGHEVSDTHLPKLCLHTWGWVPKEVGVGWKISDDGANTAASAVHSIKYLGCHIDSNNLYEKLFQETLLSFDRCAELLGRKGIG